jgi:hypothetical protein
MYDIQNVARQFEAEKYKKHTDDAKSLSLWMEEHKELIFMHQSKEERSSKAFILGIQFPWQFKALMAFGDKSVIACDSTFSTNKYGFQLFILMVFDSYRNGIPMAWIITDSGKGDDISIWLSRLN